MKKKAVSRKKKPAARKAAGRKALPKKAAKKTAKKKAGARRAASKSTRTPPRKKKTIPRAHTRPNVPSQQPVPPGDEQPPQFAGEEDEHGPMHIPSHKPAPAYAEMNKNDWAGKPPTQDIPIPKH